MYLKQPHKVRVDFDDLEFGDQTAEEVLAYKGVLFTGYATFGQYPNGQITAEEEFRNGRAQGWKNTYYANGKIERETLVYTGLYSIAFYEYDENGNVIMGGLLTSQDEYHQLVKEYRLLD